MKNWTEKKNQKIKVTTHTKNLTLHLLQYSQTTCQYGHKCQRWFVLSSSVQAAATYEYLTVSGA